MTEFFPGYELWIDDTTSQPCIWSNKTKKWLKALKGTNYLYVNCYHKGKRKDYALHRLVAEYYCEKAENKNEVDHIDRDKFNNSIQNLRWVNRSENSHNRNTRGYQKTANNRYQAYICQNYKRIMLGTYDTPEEAREAHLQKSYELFPNIK